MRAINGAHFMKNNKHRILKRSKPLKKEIKHINLEQSMGIRVLKKA